VLSPQRVMRVSHTDQEERSAARSSESISESR
jgi:hypothetical protein